jgi:hypothetical protein
LYFLLLPHASCLHGTDLNNFLSQHLDIGPELPISLSQIGVRSNRVVLAVNSLCASLWTIGIFA